MLLDNINILIENRITLYIKELSNKYNIEKNELINIWNKSKSYKISSNKINLNKWIKNGNTIPLCINKGCNNNVCIRHWTIQQKPSFKTECSRCCNIRKKNKNIDGITIHKKKYCENKDKILGFLCPMDKNRYNEFPSDIYHMDHLDGNHMNNSLNNLKTFCAICHTRKGKESGDFNSFKTSSFFHKI